MTAPREWSDDDLLSILRLRDDGLSLVKIGRAIGRTSGSVQNMLRKLDRDYAASEAGSILIHPLLG